MGKQRRSRWLIDVVGGWEELCFNLVRGRRKRWRELEVMARA